MRRPSQKNIDGSAQYQTYVWIKAPGARCTVSSRSQIEENFSNGNRQDAQTRLHRASSYCMAKLHSIRRKEWCLVSVLYRLPNAEHNKRPKLLPSTAYGRVYWIIGGGSHLLNTWGNLELPKNWNWPKEPREDLTDEPPWFFSSRECHLRSAMPLPLFIEPWRLSYHPWMKIGLRLPSPNSRFSENSQGSNVISAPSSNIAKKVVWQLS